MAESFLNNAKQHLTKTGKLTIVANSFLKYPPILEAQFDSYQTVFKNNKFAVYSSWNLLLIPYQNINMRYISRIFTLWRRLIKNK